MQLLLPIALLIGLLWWFGLQPLARTLSHASPIGLLAYAGLTSLVLVGYALRWRMAGRAVGADPPLRRLVAARLAGDALGSLVPSARLAGEPLRIGMGGGPLDTTAMSAAGVAVDRLLEVIGNMLAVIVYVSVFIATRSAASAGHAPTVLGGVMLLLLISVAALVIRMRRGGRPLAPLYGVRARALLPRLTVWMDGIGEVEDHLVRFFREHPLTLGLGILASLAIEAGCVLQYHTLLAAFGVGLDLPTLFMVLLGSGVARAVPAPGGLGVLEATQVAVVGASTGQPDLGFVVGVIVRLHETVLLAVGLLVLAYQGQSLARLRGAVRAGA